MAGARKRRRTNNNRRRKRGRSMRRMRSAPPRLSISSNTRTLRIGYAFNVSDESVRQDIFFKSLFTYPPNIGLTFQFREGRVNRAQIFWQSDNATSDAGSVCLCVEDYGENSGTNTANFDELTTYPGSMIRKVWQNVSNKWFPTEPSDRDFQSLTGENGIMTITIRHSIAGSKLKGRIIVMCDITCRGKSTDRCKLAAALLEDFEVVDTQRMQGISLQSPVQN